MENEIQVGQIWEVLSDDFLGDININYFKKRRDFKFHVKKGNKIEIRFPYEWHYRTECDIYLNSTPDYILQNCKLIGVILERVRFNNKAKLEEILRLGLYDKVKK